MSDNKKTYYWLKLSQDFFRDKPIKKLRSLAGGDTYTIIYLKMLIASLKDDGKLFYEGIDDDFVSELASDIDEKEDDVGIVVNFLLAKGLLTMVSDDEYLLTECKNMVGKENASAERVRRYRAKQEALQCNTNVTPCNAIETKCNTEKELEKEKELELDIEIEKDIPVSARAKRNSIPSTKGVQMYDKRTPEIELDIEKDIELDIDTDKYIPVSVSKKPPKHKYGEYNNVLLTDKERDTLFDEYGEAKSLEAIKYLDEYIEMKGAKYKSHYLALRKWVFEAVERNRPKQTQKSYTKADGTVDWDNV